MLDQKIKDAMLPCKATPAQFETVMEPDMEASPVAPPGLESLALVLPWAGCAPLGLLASPSGAVGSSWLVGGFGPGDPDAKSFWRGVSISFWEGGAEKINTRFFAFKK